ncbi:MAG: ABC transporter ATP-binding protein [Proteobacteria bacterium]|nr:ABC transporter ATP-binding protein [Pseudomonadota bacterium]
MSLELNGVSKTVGGQPHLYPIDLHLEVGVLHILVGRTRAGKTSLLRILAGLDSPSTGTITMNGQDLVHIPLRKRSVAMVYQEFVNYPSLTVYENIASPLRRQKAKRSDKGSAASPDIDARVRELAETLHIAHLLDRLPNQISGGQQQRVAIARALAKGADLLLLDEPLVNLDYKLREQMRDELADILTGTTTTVIYATSEPGEALAFGANTIVLDKGRVLQNASALEVYHRPASIAAASVFGDPPMNVFAVEVKDGVARLTGAEFSLRQASDHLAELDDGTYRLGIRASDCTLETTEANHLQLPGTVELCEISGSETYVHMGCSQNHFIVQEDGVFPHQLGQTLTLSIDPSRLLVFAADREGTLIKSYHR